MAWGVGLLGVDEIIVGKWWVSICLVVGLCWFVVVCFGLWWFCVGFIGFWLVCVGF